MPAAANSLSDSDRSDGDRSASDRNANGLGAEILVRDAGALEADEGSNRRQAKHSVRREQILEGMFEAMARTGTRGTSISEIASAAGIARGALHYYFESKEEIRLRLMERLGERYLQGLSTYLDRFDGDQLALTEALVRYHFAPKDDDLSRMLSVWIDFWGHAPTDQDLRQVVLQVQERAREQCLRVVACGRSTFDMQSEQARLQAATLLALVEGALLQWRIAEKSGQPLDRAALAAQLSQAAQCISAQCTSAAFKPATIPTTRGNS